MSGFSETPIVGAEWTLKVWEISPRTQSPPNLFINYAFPYPLTDVAFSKDGSWVAVTGESPADQQAAIWIYNTSDTDLYFSKGLVYMQGFSFVTETPDPALGDFVYNNGDTAYRITVATEVDTPLYSESGMLINEIEFLSSRLRNRVVRECFVSDFSLGNIHFNSEGDIVLVDMGDATISNSYDNISFFFLMTKFGALAQYVDFKNKSYKYFASFLEGYEMDMIDNDLFTLFKIKHLVNMVSFIGGLKTKSKNLIRRLPALISNAYLVFR